MPEGIGASPRGAVFSDSAIIGAQIEATYAVMRDWDCDLSREANLDAMREHNSIGASSFNWLCKLTKVIRRRFDPNNRDRALPLLAKAGIPMDVWKPIQLWHMTRDDLLLHDFLANWLFQQYQEGVLQIHTDDLLPYLLALHTQGVVQQAWQVSTRRRAASGLLHIAVDFGLMAGKNTKAFTSYHLPEDSFMYLLHALYDAQRNAMDVIQSTDWRLFLMTPADVERELLRLHQFRKLRYEVAGSLIELTLPCRSAAAYVEEMTA